MKRLLPIVAGIIFLTGCPSKPDVAVTPPLEIQQAVVVVGHEYNLQTAFASALNCDPATLTWSIAELNGPGTVNDINGWITAAGVYHAPLCGSSYLGAIQHVTAVCPATSQSGTAVVNIGQEQLSRIAIVAAIPDPSGTGACYDHSGFCTPNGSTTAGTTPCDAAVYPSTCSPGNWCQLSTQIPSNGSVNWYSLLVFSCTTAMSPPLPATLPPLCSF